MEEMTTASLSSILVEELMFAAKAIRSIESGFVCLQEKYGYGWQDVSEYSDSYYVCALFADGGRIPLPLLLPVAATREKDIYLWDASKTVLQDRIIKEATRVGMLDACITSCAMQVLQYGSSQGESEMQDDALTWLEVL